MHRLVALHDDPWSEFQHWADLAAILRRGSETAGYGAEGSGVLAQGYRIGLAWGAPHV
jgi:hypothetical protein